MNWILVFACMAAWGQGKQAALSVDAAPAVAVSEGEGEGEGEGESGIPVFWPSGVVTFRDAKEESAQAITSHLNITTTLAPGTVYIVDPKGGGQVQFERTDVSFISTIQNDGTTKIVIGETPVAAQK